MRLRWTAASGRAGCARRMPVIVFSRVLSIRDLKVGGASVDLLLTRHNEGDVGVNVLRRHGTLEVVVFK